MPRQTPKETRCKVCERIYNRRYIAPNGLCVYCFDEMRRAMAPARQLPLPFPEAERDL
jgi:hypothetical protein